MLNAHAAYITHLLFSYAWSQLTCLAIGVLFSGPGRDIGPVCPYVCVCVPRPDMFSARAAYITHLLFSYAWSQLTCLAIGVLLVLVLVVRVETSVQRVCVCVCVCVCVSVGDFERACCLHHSLFTVQHFSYAWSQLTCLAIGVLLVLVLVVRVDIGSACLCVCVCACVRACVRACVCVCVRAGDVERARCLHHSLFTVQLRLVTANLPCY